MEILSYKFTSKFTLKSLLQTSLGGVLEFYDFMIFMMLAKYISLSFFEGSSYFRIMATYLVLAIGYFSKPLGGIIFSHFGDKVGRKPTFLVSIAVMAISTLIIGVIPPYIQIGIAAPILLLIIRIIQGIALGGEVPGAITFVYEHMPKNKKMGGMAILLAGMIAGVFLGTFISFILSKIFTEKQMFEFAWRIPFVFGGIFGIIAFYIRRDVKESPIFNHIKVQKKLFSLPLAEIFKSYKLEFLCSFLLTFTYESIGVFFFALLPSYLMVNLTYTSQQAFKLSSIGDILVVIFYIIWGIFFLKVSTGKKKLIIFCSYIMTGIFSFMFMEALTHHNYVLLYISFALLIMNITIGFIIYRVIIAEMHEVRARYTGTAIPYTIGNGLAGGLTPLIITWVAYKSPLFLAPAYYLCFLSLIGAFTVLLVNLVSKMRANEPLERCRISDDNMDINQFDVSTFYDGKADKKEVQRYFVIGHSIFYFLRERRKVVALRKEREARIKQYRDKKLKRYLDEKEKLK